MRAPMQGALLRDVQRGDVLLPAAVWVLGAVELIGFAPRGWGWALLLQGVAAGLLVLDREAHEIVRRPAVLPQHAAAPGRFGGRLAAPVRPLVRGRPAEHRVELRAPLGRALSGVAGGGVSGLRVLEHPLFLLDYDGTLVPFTDAKRRRRGTNHNDAA